MTPSSLMLDFGRPVAFYPGLVKHLGSVNAVLFFCQIFYWQDKTDNPNGVYKESAEVEQETGMTYREQQTARQKLRSCGVLIETHKRLEHRIYYRIDIDRLNDLIESANKQTSSPRNDKSAIGGATNEHFVLTENTAEITAKNKTPLVDSAEIDSEASAIKAKKPKLPACPIDTIINLWSEIMPDKKQPLASIWKQGQNGVNLSNRWKQCFAIQHSREDRKLYHDLESGIEFWRLLFQHLRKSEFLMADDRNFFGLDWIVKKANFEKILEGKYHA